MTQGKASKDMVRSPARRGAGPGRLLAGTHGRSQPDDGAELAEMRAQSRELRETIEAIRTGSVDSLMIGPPGQEQVYALASADRPYRLIIEAMNEGAATVSPRGVILDANPRLSSMTGRDATELIGTAVLDLAPDAYRLALARLLDVRASGSARGEACLAGPGGEIVSVQVAVSGFDLDGMFLRCVILTDLTAQRGAEAEVAALNAELETRVERRTADLKRANKNLETFAYSVAHDLRTPLRGLNGFSEVLLDEYGDCLEDTGRGYAKRIQAASAKMGTIIDDLLQLSRFSRAEISLGLIDLSAEFAAIADELRAREPGRRVRFAIQDGVSVIGDHALIHTLVQNLVENAWKFTARRDDATIEFRVMTHDEARVFYVRDNGAGFDPAYTSKLFQPFQRLHAAGDFPGTGIGLASVQRIVERHGGHTWAQGEVDRGATFYFTLGAAEAA